MRCSFFEAPEWANIIGVIRNVFLSRPRNPLKYLPITCRNRAGEDIVLHFNMKDVYLVGFTLGPKNYEFGFVESHKLPGSDCLLYNSGYGDMGHRSTLTDINIGFRSLRDALLPMIRGPSLGENWKHVIRGLIPTVLVMLPECVRFKWHYLAVRRMMTAELDQGPRPRVNRWMEHGIKNWQVASNVAFKMEHTDSKNGSMPLDENHDYDLPDVERALTDWVWARDLLFVHCVVERKPLHVLVKHTEGKGKNTITYNLVLWNNKDMDWQTESDMKQKFSGFNTEVTYPTPVLQAGEN